LRGARAARAAARPPGPGRRRLPVARGSGGLVADVEGARAARPVAVDGKVVVEAGDAAEPEALHQREAGAIDDREVLVLEGLADPPGGAEVDGQDRPDRGQSAADAAPEAVRGCP